MTNKTEKIKAAEKAEKVKVTEKAIDVSKITYENAREFAINDKAFEKQVMLILKTGIMHKEAIISASMQALIKAFAHDDYSRMTKVYNAVSAQNAGTAKQVKEWFEKFSPAKLVDTKAGKAFRKSNSKTANPFNLNAAVKNPYTTIGVLTEKEVKEKLDKIFACIDLEKSLEALTKKYKKALKEGHVVPEEARAIRATLEVIEHALSPVKELEEATESKQAA